MRHRSHGGSTRQARHGRAFTLVELLVVIGIISLLVGILLPVVSKARRSAQRVACLSNVRQIYAGIMLYCDNNRDWFPTCAAAADGLAYSMYADDWIYWQPIRNLDESPIARYLQLQGDALARVLRCPADDVDAHRRVSGLAAGQTPYRYSYGLNEGVGLNYKPPLVSVRCKRGQWLRPAEKIMIGEGDSLFSGGWGAAGVGARRHGEAISPRRGVLMGTSSSAAFFDGHAASVDDDFYYFDTAQTQPDG